MKKPRIPGGLMVFFAAVCWSLNAPLVRFIELDALAVSGLRGLIAGIALSPWLIRYKVKWNRWTALYVASYGTLSITIVLALRMTSPAIAVGMQFTGIIWLFLAGLVTKKERFSWRAFAPILVVMAGMGCFMSTGTDATTAVGNLLALAGSVLFATTTVSAKRLTSENPLALSSLAGLCLGLFVFVLLPPTFSQIAGLSGRDWGVMLALGVVQIGMGYAFYNIGVRTVSAQKATILALFEMILGPVWVAIFFRDYPGPMVVAGLVVILGGIVADALLNASPAVPAPAKTSPE